MISFRYCFYVCLLIPFFVCLRSIIVSVCFSLSRVPYSFACLLRECGGDATTASIETTTNGTPSVRGRCGDKRPAAAAESASTSTHIHVYGDNDCGDGSDGGSSSSSGRINSECTKKQAAATVVGPIDQTRRCMTITTTGTPKTAQGAAAAAEATNWISS